MKWIVAIRRDVGKYFLVTTHTRVCSRHFKPSDYLPSLTGRKRTLKPTAILSVFHWKKRSPVKRKAPTRRIPIKKEKAGDDISLLKARVFTIDRFESDKDVTFYTGFPNRIVFKSVFEFLTLETRAKT